ncbi:MAG: hypothetical protein J5637_02925 [Prevotella sp.]|nr:hypothetical protein [Prevotella sp.]
MKTTYKKPAIRTRNWKYEVLLTVSELETNLQGSEEMEFDGVAVGNARSNTSVWEEE